MKEIIKIEELVNLKEKGLSNEEISEYLTKIGKPLNRVTVGQKLKKYYQSKGITRYSIKGRRGRKRIKISIQEILKMKEQGKSIQDISEYHNVSIGIIYSRLREYNKLNNIKCNRGRKKVNLHIDGIILMLKQGKSVKEISEYFKVSPKTVRQRIKEHCQSNPDFKKDKNKSSTDILKEILLKGMTIDEYVQSSKTNITPSEINYKLKKLEFVVEHVAKSKNKWVADNDFLEVISTIQNQELLQSLEGRIQRKGLNACNNNNDLKTYFILRLKEKPSNENEQKEFQTLQNGYKEKIKKYFNYLQNLEAKTENKHIKKKGENKQPEEEER